MELMSLAKEVLQNVAEYVASYRVGQSALRYLDRGLWVVEKCARWAVPPPLDQDDRPQPELVRPLPWVFFLALLIMLRITRESISLINLIMGKPPLRSADVVTYVQSKRRYLRTLKYQGSRVMRARAAAPSWAALLRPALCMRPTTTADDDQCLVVKRNKRGQQPTPCADSTMERLIERMMLDLDADSADDSSYTLTNATSIRSDRSDTADSDQDTVLHNDSESTPEKGTQTQTSIEINFTPSKSAVSTPEKNGTEDPENPENPENQINDANSTNNTDNGSVKADEALEATEEVQSPKKLSTKEETQLFLQTESCTTIQRSVKIEHKPANGNVSSGPGKKKGLNNKRRDSDVCLKKNKSSDKTM